MRKRTKATIIAILILALLLGSPLARGSDFSDKYQHVKECKDYKCAMEYLDEHKKFYRKVLPDNTVEYGFHHGSEFITLFVEPDGTISQTCYRNATTKEYSCDVRLNHGSN